MAVVYRKPDYQTRCLLYFHFYGISHIKKFIHANERQFSIAIIPSIHIHQNDNKKLCSLPGIVLVCMCAQFMRNEYAKIRAKCQLMCCCDFLSYSF